MYNHGDAQGGATRLTMEMRQQGLEAMVPGAVEDRAKVIINLIKARGAAGTFFISQAHGRSQLRDYFAQRQKWGDLFILLTYDLDHWLPPRGEFDNLHWLLAALMNVMAQSQGQKAELTLQTPGGPVVKQSSAYLETLREEAVYAAAQAWMRCLGGAGGEHRVWELPPVLQDQELARAIMMVLAAHPGHLTQLLEDMPPQLEQTCLTSPQLVEFWQRGLRAAEFCRDIIDRTIGRFSKGV